MSQLRRLILPLSLLLLLLSAPLSAAAPAATESADTGKVDASQKASDGSGTTDTTKKDDAGKGQGSSTPKASVQEICVGTSTEIGTDAGQTVAHLGDWLTLNVEGIEELKPPLQLYLNGLPLPKVPAIYYQPEQQREPQSSQTGCRMKTPHYPLVRFHLVRNEESKDTWALLLGRAAVGELRQVEASVGKADCAEGCTDISTPKPIQLEAIRAGWFKGYCAVIVLLLASLLLLAYFTALLHDRGIDSAWSLGRSQMAWWFFFVIGAFLYIWMVTGSYSSLSNSVLALIGISATTAVLGAVIDDSKQTQAAQRAALETKKAALEAANKALLPTDSVYLANTEELKKIDAELAQLPKEQKTTHNFLRDILSDENGISFHRYQIVIWTVVLAVIFVVRVHVNLAMPDFDGQLLALMGISSGTYLGFKLPEKKT